MSRGIWLLVRWRGGWAAPQGARRLSIGSDWARWERLGAAPLGETPQGAIGSETIVDSSQ